MEYIQTEKHKKTFRDLILNHLSKILELSCDEFRGGYIKKEIKGNYVEEVYVPDSRKRISQAIEFFSFLLQPKYDKDMNEKSEEIKKKLEINLKEYNEEKISKDRFTINKLTLMKSLFEELNFLLAKKDYLKGESYEDVMEEDGEDEVNEEDEKIE